MTIREAALKGIRRLRLRPWNDRAYIRLFIENGQAGSVAYFFDLVGRGHRLQMGVGQDEPEIFAVGPQDGGRGWEKYTGELDPLDTEGEQLYPGR